MNNRQLIWVVVGMVASTVGSSDAVAKDWSDSSSGSSPEAVRVDRSGIFGGASLGRGSIEVSCSSCDDGGGTLTEGLSVEAHIGLMLTSQIGIVAEHWNVRYNQRGGALFDDSARHLVAQHISTVGVQVFLGSSIWFRTGLGVGWHITDGEYANKKNPQGSVFFATGAAGEIGGATPSDEPLGSLSPAYYAAIGWEFANTRNLAAEVQLRIGGTQRPEDEYQVRNVGMNVGMSWY